MITSRKIFVVVIFLSLYSSSFGKPSSIGVESANETKENVNVNFEQNLITDHNLEYRKSYATLMLTYMNQTVDPCDDFYEYACGNWKNVIKARQSQKKRSNLLDIIYNFGDAIDELLHTTSEKLVLDFETEINLAKLFYQSCLEAELYPFKMSPNYLRVIKSIGGFPAVDDTWNATNFSWFNMSAHLTNYGAVGLINEEILPQYPFAPYFKLPEMGFDYKVHSDNIVSNTSRGFQLNEKRMRSYLEANGVSEAKILQVISSIFEFWREVLKMADQFEEDELKCSMLSEELDKKEFEQWDNYFEIVWNKKFDSRGEDWSCSFFYQELDTICNKHKEAVANYLAMKFLYKMDAQIESVVYQKDYCTMNLISSMPFLIDKLYLTEYFNDEIRNEISTIVDEMRKSLHIILENADWLDETTRTEALLKESTIITRIGSFKDAAMTERLIREMINLTFVDGNYEQSQINLKKFSQFIKRFNGLHIEQLPNSTMPLELLVGMQVNAFYYNVDNSINVMAGILHPPAYHTAWPHSMKFGTIGYLVGHELTHGFDSFGSQFDGTGKRRDWWSEKSGNIFNERANCYVDHFNSYLVPEINRNVNGNKTKDENIADSGGLREALNSYRRYMKQLTKDVDEVYILKNEQMPGLDLSPEQLFFLSFAQVWCAAYKEEHYWEELTDEHTMDKYRVLGALTNNEDFANTYNCSLGSNMHPTPEKCRVW